MKNKLLPLLVIFVFIFTTADCASAIEFKILGQWLMNFAVGPNKFVKSTRNGNTRSTPTQELFAPAQRIRLQMRAIASENLSGTIRIQLGPSFWGNSAQGAALGADGNNIKLREAYIDWTWPDNNLKTRMGIHMYQLPSKAGGSIVMWNNMAAIITSWQANENNFLTGLWSRPFNDNYPGYETDGKSGVDAHYLDNLDVFALIWDMKYDGWEFIPWAMYGMQGKNTMWNGGNNPRLTNYASAGNPTFTMYPYPGIMNRGSEKYSPFATEKDYANLFWFGLPLQITSFDPWNFEFDFNYGYSEGLGRFNAYKGEISEKNLKRSATSREGWIAKALLEYKTDWGVPGIYGWYGSGDDGNPKNGSERMPSLLGYGLFTSFMGNTTYSLGNYYNLSLDYSGTWGCGLRIKDLSFVDNLKHTIRATWWGGTNSPDMIKYMATSYSWTDGWRQWDGPYMTTKDGFLEANLINTYKMYDNLTFWLELSYIANFMDNKAWSKAGYQNTSFEKQDAWKAELAILYSF